MVGVLIGLIRVSPMNPKLKIEVVCADFVTNGTLAAIWDKAHETDVSNIDESNTIVHITAQDPSTWGNVVVRFAKSSFQNR